MRRGPDRGRFGATGAVSSACRSLPRRGMGLETVRTLHRRHATASSGRGRSAALKWFGLVRDRPMAERVRQIERARPYNRRAGYAKKDHGPENMVSATFRDSW